LADGSGKQTNEAASVGGLILFRRLHHFQYALEFREHVLELPQPRQVDGSLNIQAIAVHKDAWSGKRRRWGRRRVLQSYVERQNLSLRMASRRFTRLTYGFSKKLNNHVAAVSLYGAHYNLCRAHETLRITPAVAIGITDHVWSIGELLDAALATQPIDPVVTAPDRRRRFRVIEGGKTN
jgi:hypothetical protein